MEKNSKNYVDDRSEQRARELGVRLPRSSDAAEIIRRTLGLADLAAAGDDPAKREDVSDRFGYLRPMPSRKPKRGR